MNPTRACPKCGAPLPADAPQGHCPQCLLALAVQAAPGEATQAALEQATLDSGSARHGAPPSGGPGGGPAKAGTPNPAPALQFKPGDQVRYFGDYELLEEIARGGMGVVFKARQQSLNRIVAVKMILGGQLATEADVKRFRTEAEAAANLQHPNIVAIHEIGEHEGRHYFSMDYVEGKNLAQVIGGEPMPPLPAATLLKTLAEAVHYAHQRGTLHRDLKPHNVLIDHSGQPRITDFGLAKLIQQDSGVTQEGSVMGSPSYMPPEQATGRQADVGPASDVYSLGAILYQMLTGQVPFSGATAVDTLRAVVEQEPVAPAKLNDRVPTDLETICLKCLEKKPERRYASARALAEELARFLNHEPILARPASAARKAVAWCRRHPWVLTGVATLAVLGLLGLAFGLWERTQFLEWKAAHPGQARKELGVDWFQSPLLLWMVWTPFMLSLFLVWTVKDLRRDGGWKYRVHAGMLALMGGLSVMFGIVLTLEGIRSLVWRNRPSPVAMLGEFGGGMIFFAFVWVGSTLLWRLTANHYGHQFGLQPPAPAPATPERKKLGKWFWLVLVGEFVAINLLPGWVVTPGQHTALGFNWDEVLRGWFVMFAMPVAMIPVFLALGIRRQGNGRWGFFFAAALVLLMVCNVVNGTFTMLADHPKSLFEHAKWVTLWAVLTGVTAGGVLAWIALSRKRRDTNTIPPP